MLLWATTSQGASAGPQRIATDSIPHPATRTEHTSPSGAFQFVVSTPDSWKTAHATGELFLVTGSTPRSMWRRTLPQQFGPRLALVTDRGEVLLLDEWIIRMSSYAVMVITPRGDTLAQWSFDDVQKAMGVEMARIVTHERIGFWIAREPVIEQGATRVVVPTVAAKTLVVSLVDGRLSTGSQ
jgi:hypothetical protein